jgi:hypothetical protein
MLPRSIHHEIVARGFHHSLNCSSRDNADTAQLNSSPNIDPLLSALGTFGHFAVGRMCLAM